jgi:hypothetical protein
MKVHFSGLNLLVNYLIIRHMKQNFIIKEGKQTLYYFICICLFFVLVMARQTGSNLTLLPLMLLLMLAVLMYTIMRFRWMSSFAVFLDVDKEELILNHNWAFRKKHISLKDIKEIDTLNGNIILSASTPLSKWQRMVCKTKRSNDYTVRFDTIDACEKRKLMELLYTLKSEE